ncbi:MAG TPA: prephenate dehydrogenase/arogenate dehydrogenase family protein [Gaiellaceae bacterium]|nr:prephenate dehydrogenase/arogenate dehydrogenase family protein [Gaiellaceae bacterium]
MTPDRLAVVGTGLIGASVGLAAKRAGIGRVVGWDADAEALALAAARGALDDAAGSLRAAVADADLAIVATPVASLGAEVDAALAGGSGATVSDVGSTKSGLCESVSDRQRFIGGHPVCGSEARGPGHASAELFEGATWFLTPLAETEPERYRLLHGFVASLGAVPVAIDPGAHDRLMAVTSHLPHALANLMLNYAGSIRVDGHEPLATAGGSLRDMTRVAGANPRIWVDIFLDNAAELRASLAEHRRRVEDLERALESGDAGWLARWIGEAAGNRRSLFEEAYRDAGALQRVRVHVPDRPGVLSGITQALGAEQINIEDFELQHLSPDRGGTLSVLVAGEGEASRAAALLEAQGYSVIVSPAFEDE